MREGTKTILALAVLAVVAVAAFPQSRRALALRTGAVVPNGTGELKREGEPFRIVSMVGTRRKGEREVPGAAVFHALLLFRGGIVADVEEDPSSAPGDVLDGELDRRWSVTQRVAPGVESGHVHDLRVRYSPLLKRVTIGRKIYALADGNLFVVRYGPDGPPAVTQLPETVPELGSGDGMYQPVLGAYRSLLRDDPMVQRLPGAPPEVRP